MILKLKRHTLYFLLAFLVLIGVSILTFERTSFATVKEDIVQYVMSMDLGFSHQTNLVDEGEGIFQVQGSAEGLSRYRAEREEALLKSIPKIIKYKFQNNSFERIDIDIPFLEYQQILLDREEALSKKLNIDPDFVKATLKYKGKNYRAKLRLKGDSEDHWRSQYRMSFRVELKDNKTILGYKKFTIQKPIARQFPYDYSFQSLLSDINNLASAHKFARIYINGTSWGVMNVEEHMSKEFLEKQRKKESLIVRFGDEKKWQYNVASSSPYGWYLISDPALIINPYNGRKYLKDSYYRKIYTYISREQVSHNRSLYDTDSFIKAYVASTVWGNWHPLLDANGRYYFNPYTLKLESIATEQAGYVALKGSESIKFNQLPKQYYQILSSPTFKKDLSRNLESISQGVYKVQKHFDQTSKFFPVDKAKKSNLLIENIEEFVKDQSEYTNPSITPKEGFLFSVLDNLNFLPPTVLQASEFKEHLYVRHLTNGNLELYNLLPDEITVKQLLYEDVPTMNLNVKIPSYKKNPEPKIIKTQYLGLQDKNISVVSSYQNFHRTSKNEYSLISEKIRNPLLENKFKCSSICNLDNGIYVFNKGNWIVESPIIIKGDVRIPPGTNLFFKPSAYLIIKGNIVAEGTPEEPITFKAEKDFWKGLYVLNAEKKSSLKNIKIHGLNSLEDDLLRLTGGITFYKSDVSLENILIENVIAEDAINVVESNFEFNSVHIKNTSSDAFDSDFSKGSIKDSFFSEIKGDALDFSGSISLVENVSLARIGDKGISVGERSTVTINNSNLEEVSVGVTSKDASKVVLRSTTIKDFDHYGVMSFIKKDFYSNESIIQVIECNIEGSSPFLRQSGTIMFVDDVEIKQEDFDVDKFYKRTEKIL